MLPDLPIALAVAVPERELAGLAAAVLWSFSALAWSVAGRRAGSVPVTVIRIVLAALILMLARAVFLGGPLPAALDAESFWIVVASGLAGAFAADMCQFRGLVLIGPRLGVLIQSLSPIVTAFLAWVLFGESLGAAAIVGIALTVGGVVWVLLEQRGRDAWPCTRAEFVEGVSFCLVSTVLVSVGFVLSRVGMNAGPRWFSDGPLRTGVGPFDGTLIRVAAAAIASVAALPFLRSVGRTLAALRDRRTMAIIVFGTVVGPVVGIWMSMIALEGISAGVAVAFINMCPLIMIPISYFAYGERPSPRTIFGTILAVGGVAVLMLR